MPAKNIYHDAVVAALEADGWTITDDPLTITYGDRKLFVDLGAEQLTIGAERAGERIAVEIQSFLGASPVRDLEEAVGQYQIYLAILQETDQERMLYMAVPTRIYDRLLTEPLGQLVVERLHLRLIVFNEKTNKVLRWIR